MWLHLERCHIQSLYCSCSTEATGCPSREDTPTFSFCIDITSNMHIVHIAQEKMKFGKIFLMETISKISTDQALREILGGEFNGLRD